MRSSAKASAETFEPHGRRRAGVRGNWHLRWRTRGVQLDPSAVTRIERGTREVKLREAATMADCLERRFERTADPAESTIRFRWRSSSGARRGHASVPPGLRLGAVRSPRSNRWQVCSM